jgi:ankyrin repeat protein
MNHEKHEAHEIDSHASNESFRVFSVFRGSPIRFCKSVTTCEPAKSDDINMKTKSALLVLTRGCNRGELNRKVGFIFASIALCVFPLIQPSFAATNDLTSALQKGLFEEEANHNLEAAAQAYQNVSAQFDKDRKLAATAIFRLGEVYRKQGKTNEAVLQYERVVREFSDQQTLATLSRQNLIGLEAGPKSPVNQSAGVQPTSSPPVTDDEEKEIRRIQAMIQNSPDLINAPGSGGFTPLHTAANQGQLIVARFLLDNGADVNCRNSNQETPLTLAAARGHKAMVELLLSRKADVNVVGGGGYTALHQVAQYGFKTVAEVLLANKANASATTISGATPLHLAAGVGNNALVELLLANGAKVSATDNQGNTLLMSAAAGGRAAAVSTLLKAKSDVDAQNGAGRTALSFAVNKKSLDTIKALLAEKADPNAGQLDLPLAEAVYDNQVEIAELLLKAGADPNAACKFSTYIVAPGGNSLPGAPGSYGPYTPLQIAVSRGNSKMAALLFQFKADPSSKDPWFSPPVPLIDFALNNPEMLKAFLDAGADANGNGRSGHPLLVGTVSESAVKLLLEHGAKPNVRGKDDNTPLFDAVSRNNKESAELLLAANADPNLAAFQGMTPLHSAVNWGSAEVVEMLVAHGANLNAKQKDGFTPLHWAFVYEPKGIGRKAVVELLLNKGANPNIQNDRGQTPLDLTKVVKVAGMNEIADVLRAHGALDELPDFSSIRLTRAGVEQTIVFRRDTNGVNHFTLLEAIRNFYPQPKMQWKAGPNGALISSTVQNQANPTILPFPDFSRLTILRRTDPSGGKQKEIEVNVLNASNGFDPGKDVVLEFGDIVEVREREHTLSEDPVGLSQEQDEHLTTHLKKRVSFVIKGNPQEVIVEGRKDAAYLSVALQQDSVKRVLRSSSDMSRLKIKRTDPATKKTTEIAADAQVFMAGKKPLAEDVWVRDGDVIEVPDKL